ncbi:MAG: GTP 3',8-cyclase MoaA [Eubacteriales bacterium]|nr:GTP 3',8-cyclase MoaA [Eubacteriales bacterium]
MRDHLGRDIRYLRISLTERCDLKCIYCREETAYCQAKRELSVTELARLMGLFAGLGITKVRLTGGEPLVRRDLEEIVHMIARIPQVRDLSMTTNAQSLADRVGALRRAGLQRVNISLDSLQAERYHRMTRGGTLQKALDGLHAALREGLTVKVNVVLVRGENDAEIDDFVALARNYPIDVRFIELMPFCALSAAAEKRVPGEEILARHPALRPVAARHPSQPAADYQEPGALGRVGLIDPISHRFCCCCDRVRLTSDGKLRMCLGQEKETDLRAWMDKSDTALRYIMQKAIYNKPDAHGFDSGFHAVRAMNQIGG